MANFLDKFKVKTALEKNTTLDLSCQHLTTSNWMEYSPVYTKEMVPGEKLNVNMETFARLAAMPVPTLGRSLIHNRAFFVPYRTVFKGWNDFITDTMHVSSDLSAPNTIPSTVPYFSNIDILKLFFDATGEPLVKVADIPSASDATLWIHSYNQDGTFGTSGSIAFSFTNLGRRFLKILHSLGYRPIWDLSVSDGAAEIIADEEWFSRAIKPNPDGDGQITDIYVDFVSLQSYITAVDTEGYGYNTVKNSALPLFSALKVYVDWYWPSQYVGDVAYNRITSLLSDDVGRDPYISGSDLYFVLNSIKAVNYDSDYFVSAFDAPTGPAANDVNVSTMTMYDVNNTNGGSSNLLITNDIDDDAVYAPKVGNATEENPKTNNVHGISQYALDALKAMTDYFKRHQLVGSRALDRYYARFGKSLSAEKLNRSNYIGAMNQPIQFADVFSHSDTEGAQLGAFAGKGLSYGGQGFEFSTDEYGMFIIVSSIIPIVGYYQGQDRTTMHLNRLDFWTPEFDQLGNQAIARRELYIPQFVDSNDTQMIDTYYTSTDNINGVFGWTPRYSEYKIGRDKMTGDFQLHSKSAAGDTSTAWNLMRDINMEDFYDSSKPNELDIVHTIDFVQGTDNNQYNRIFYNTNSNADKFYVIHNFNVTSNSPMHSLYDSYEFDSKGDSVVADVNGVKVN
jgi:hypothetical protein